MVVGEEPSEYVRLQLGVPVRATEMVAVLPLQTDAGPLMALVGLAFTVIAPDTLLAVGHPFELVTTQ